MTTLLEPIRTSKKSISSFVTSISLTLIIVFIVGLVAMPRQEYPGDPLVVRCETISLINNGSLEVPASLALSNGNPGQFFIQNNKTNKWYSKYGTFNSIIYLPALFMQKWREGKLTYFIPSHVIFVNKWKEGVRIDSSSSSRVLYLNFLNIVLAMVSALYLYLIASRYTKSRAIIIIFVLTAFYSTYWWNYLRAQNSEIYQTLFMLGFYYYLSACFRSPVFPQDSSKKSKSYFLAGVFLGALILAKMFYIILLPIVGLFFIFNERERYYLEYNQPIKKISQFPFRSFFWLALPIALALCFVLFINNYKFGSPFTTGYEQEQAAPLFSGNIFTGLNGFLFSIHQSIFLYFPTLLFALVGYRYFLKTYKLETLFLISLGLEILLITSKFIGWAGEWCYGPRYMLPILPLLSLPFIHTLETLINNRGKILATACIVIISCCLLYSFRLQRNVNALPFFVYYKLKETLEHLKNPKIEDYLTNRPFGIINRDLLAFKKSGHLEILDMASKNLTSEELGQLITLIRLNCISNYYFWPDPNDIHPSYTPLQNQ